MATERKLGVGLYGRNGHQLHRQLADGHPEAVLIAERATLDELLQDARVDLVSLCSPRRADQARDAIRCLEAGKHVYAEKPCALVEADLDAIIATARVTGRRFCEMGGTYLETPYREVRAAIREGLIGEVVQVLAQKSYPWFDERPTDEAIDGGLAMQVGVYVMRFVEHVAGLKVTAVDLRETPRAASFLIQTASGAVGSAICNYLNPIGRQQWGWESLRVFGTKGAVESDPLRLLVLGEEPRALSHDAPAEDQFTRFARSLRGGPPLPLSLEEELSPTRWVIRARARRAGERAGAGAVEEEA